MNESVNMLPGIAACLDCPWRDTTGDGNAHPRALHHATQAGHRVSVINSAETLIQPAQVNA